MLCLILTDMATNEREETILFTGSLPLFAPVTLDSMQQFACVSACVCVHLV